MVFEQMSWYFGKLQEVFICYIHFRLTVRQNPKHRFGNQRMLSLSCSICLIIWYSCVSRTTRNVVLGIQFKNVRDVAPFPTLRHFKRHLILIMGRMTSVYATIVYLCCDPRRMSCSRATPEQGIGAGQPFSASCSGVDESDKLAHICEIYQCKMAS